MSIAEVKRYEPDDLLNMADAVGYELVDGELVERHVSVLSSLVEGLVFERIQTFCRTNNLGLVWPGTVGYQCFPDRPRKVRRPDTSYIAADRLSDDLLHQGHCPIAPDLAVEVISPGDLASEVNEKIEEYLTVGIRLIWIIDPEARIVDVYRFDGPVNRLRESDFIDGEAVLPGFRCAIKDFFPDRPKVN